MRVIKAFIAILMLASNTTQAATASPLSVEERIISQIYEAPEFKKEEIFSAAKSWMTENLTTMQRALIEHESPTDGVLIANAAITYPCKGIKCFAMSDVSVLFAMKTETKDGKLRITFTDIRTYLPEHYSLGSRTPASEGPVSPKEMELIRPILLGYGDNIISSLSKYSTSSDW